MRFLLTLIATCWLSLLPAHGDTDEIVSLFGVANQAWGAEVSPDGRYVAMGCAPLGPPAICVYSLTSNDKPKLYQVPEKTRLTTFYWVGPKHIIVEVNLYDRLEVGNKMRSFTFNRAISYNVETGNSVVLLKKDAKYLIDATRIVALKPNEPDSIQMLLPFWNIEVFNVDLDTGKAKRVKKYKDEVWYPYLDSNGDPIATVYYDGSYTPTQVTGSNIAVGSRVSDFELRLPDGRVVYQRKAVDHQPFYVWGVAPNGKDLLVVGNDEEFYGMRILSVETGELAEVEIDENDFSLALPIEDIYTNQVIGFSHIEHLAKQTFIVPEFKSVHDELSTAFPDQTVRITSWTADRSMMTVSVETPGEPKSYYLYDKAGPTVSPLGSLAPQLEGHPLGTVEAVEYRASDGLQIPAYLTLPAGKKRSDGPFPLILMPHGGPEARDTASFDWWAQSYAAAGYAVLQPNFRGSTGYGEDYRNKGHGEFGGKMITDTLDGYEWALKVGLAKPGGYCIVGGSYGGYAALQGAVLGGERVKCAIAVSAVGDPISFIRDLSEESDTYEYWTEYMGFGRFSTDEDKARYIPIQNSGAVSAKLLVIHGKQDTTVPFEQARMIANAFSGHSDFRFVEMEGEDHYLQSTQARQTVLKESLDFLAVHFPVE